jgi:hypothetical protein
MPVLPIAFNSEATLGAGDDKVDSPIVHLDLRRDMKSVLSDSQEHSLLEKRIERWMRYVFSYIIKAASHVGRGRIDHISKEIAAEIDRRQCVQCDRVKQPKLILCATGRDVKSALPFKGGHSTRRIGDHHRYEHDAAFVALKVWWRTDSDTTLLPDCGRNPLPEQLLDESDLTSTLKCYNPEGLFCIPGICKTSSELFDEC